MIRLRFWPVVFGCLGAGAIGCLTSLHLSRSAFTGYDVSPMIDAGWRILNGQAPSQDFIATFPPSLYMSVALAYRWFGVTWHAIAEMECVLYAVMVLLGLRVAQLVQRVWGEQVGAGTLLSYVTGQTLLLVSINYPWHASMAESFGLYAVLATLPLLGEAVLPRAARVECYAHLLLVEALLILSKPNTAYPAILLCVALLLVFRRSWVGVAVSLGGGIVTAELLLSRVHTSLPLMLKGYFGLAGRLYPRGLTVCILHNIDPHFGLVSLVVYAILAPLLTALCVLLWRNRQAPRTMPAILLALGAITIAILGMATNYDFKLTDTPLLLLGTTILSLCGFPDRALASRTSWATLALFLLALYIGRSRYRMVWAAELCRPVLIQDRFLGTMTACPVLRAELAEVDRTLAAYPGAKVFFGPSLEFLYAGRHLPEPLHLPDWWDPGTSYALEETDRVVRGWESDRFTLLVFPQSETLQYLPPEISADINRDFERVGDTEAIHVYRPRAIQPGR